MKKREINRVNHNHETKPERRHTHTHLSTAVVCCCSAAKSRPAVCVTVKTANRSPSGQEKAGFTRGGGRGVHLYQYFCGMILTWEGVINVVLCFQKLRDASLELMQ